MMVVESECQFESRAFSCFTNMVETLLHEANQQIAQIDVGQKENTPAERVHIKWRLLHLQEHFGERVPVEYRSTYNSLWSHLYRLEHQVQYRHPYTVYVLEKLLCHASSHRG